MSRIVSKVTAGGSKLAAVVGGTLASGYGDAETQSQLDQFNEFATGWTVFIVTAFALMAVAVLVFAKVGSGTTLTRREKTLRILVIAAVAVVIIVLLAGTTSVFLMGLIWALLVACFAMFLLRWIAPQVGDATDYVGRAFSEEKREAARELDASQEAQSERGSAMEDVLQDMIEERGDEELIEESEHEGE
jgi:amino acid transporter